MAAAPELIPEEATAATAIPWLAALCALVTAYGIIVVVDAFTRALFSTVASKVGWIPFAGKVLKLPIEKIEQKITHNLGRAALFVEGQIGHAWHQLSKLIRRLGDQLEGLAWDLAVLSAALVEVAKHAISRPEVGRIVKPLKGANADLRKLVHGAHVAIRELRQLLAKTIPGRIKVIEHRVERVVRPQIRIIRQTEVASARDLRKAWRWIIRHPRSAASTGFIAAVAFALTRLGGNWIRCRNWRRIGRHVCRLHPGEIDNLLGILGGGLALAHYRDLIREMQKIERVAAQEVIDLLHAFD